MTATTPIADSSIWYRDDLYYSAIRPRQAVSEAREWLLECFPQHEWDIRHLNAVGVVTTVQNQYDGGYLAFLRDWDNLRPGR
jgi:hypothetical protein